MYICAAERFAKLPRMLTNQEVEEEKEEEEEEKKDEKKEEEKHQEVEEEKDEKKRKEKKAQQKGSVVDGDLEDRLETKRKKIFFYMCKHGLGMSYIETFKA